MALQAKNTHDLAPYRKSLPIPDLEKEEILMQCWCISVNPHGMEKGVFGTSRGEMVVLSWSSALVVDLWGSWKAAEQVNPGF